MSAVRVTLTLEFETTPELDEDSNLSEYVGGIMTDYGMKVGAIGLPYGMVLVKDFDGNVVGKLTSSW